MKSEFPENSIPEYIGRFAPSPTGPLHFGSLVCALASYLDAKANHGLWLLRIDDLDPPRESEGSAKKILQQLEEHGLHWDKEVLFQSQRNSAYLSAIKKLKGNDLVFRCYCSRKGLQGGVTIHNYPCQSENLTNLYSLRLKAKDNSMVEFSDIFQGNQSQFIKKDVGDMVLYRKEKLFSYNLAVVVDDAFQQITHIFRGGDLLDVTPSQIYLQKLLGLQTPVYGHIPIVVNDEGVKLSKQNLAASLDRNPVQINLINALKWLGLEAPTSLFKRKNSDQILTWAINNWQRNNIACEEKKQQTYNSYDV
jgi:glutamyl-Q tRNA(Asp) synthetase